MKRSIIYLLAIAGLLSGCGGRSDQPQLVHFKGMVFGTFYTVTYYSEQGTDYQKSIDSLFLVFNRSLSTYDPTSLISRINQGEAEVVDKYFKPVFIRAQEISDETGGAFDATVSPLVNAWGFGFKEKEKITPELIDSMLKLVGYQKVSLDDHRIVRQDPRVQLDFNAIAKGYAADVAGAFLESKGITAYLVEIGGDLLARGEKPDGSKWRIGLEVPAETADAPQQWDYLVEIRDQGLATSGNYRRYYEEGGVRYSHTIDPFSGYPVDHSLLSVSVIAPDAMSADAYATAFMVIGVDKSIQFVEAREDLEAYFIFSDRDGGIKTRASSGLALKKRGAR